jgi:hypothetical protein
MSRLFIVEWYKDFSTASKKAKELAVQHEEFTSVERKGAAWVILASHSVATAHLACERDNYNDPFEDEYCRYLEEVTEEIESNYDSWDRSDEEGWFYED